MAKVPSNVIEQTNSELTDLDEQILAILFDEGARSLRYISNSVDSDVGKSHICRRLNDVLVDGGPVEKVDRGLYELQLEDGYER